MTLGIPFPDPRPRIYRISPTRRWFDDSKTEPGSRCSWQPPPSRWWTQHKTSCPWFQWTPRMPGNWWHLKVWVSDEHWSNMMKHKKLSRLECKVKRVNKQQDKKGCSAHTHTHSFLDDTCVYIAYTVYICLHALYTCISFTKTSGNLNKAMALIVIKLAAMPADAMAAVMSMAHLFLPAWPFAIKFSTYLPHARNIRWSLYVPFYADSSLHPNPLKLHCFPKGGFNQIYILYLSFAHVKKRGQVQETEQSFTAKAIITAACAKRAADFWVSKPQAALFHFFSSLSFLGQDKQSEKMSKLQWIAAKMYGGEHIIRG